MSYGFHITRAEDWSEGEAKPILQEEWEDLAHSDDRLIDGGWAEWADTGRAAAFFWRSEEGPSFTWRGGQVDIKGVRSEPEIGELVVFARGLAATVQGDDGELYGDDGEPA